MLTNHADYPVTTETACAVGERVPEVGIPLPPEIIAELPAPSNGTFYPAWEVGLKAASYGLVILLGLGGNTLVILIVAVSRRLRTLTNLYVCNLAVSDLLVCLMCTWPHLGKNITSDWPFGAAMCKLVNFFQGKGFNAWCSI